MRRCRWAGRDRGSFTAELAAGLPALLLLLFVGLTAVDAVGTKGACLHAAREAAIATSRGADGWAVVRVVAPPGAKVSIDRDGQRVRVTVRAPVRALGTRMPRLMVTATAVAVLEPGPGPFPPVEAVVGSAGAGG